MYSSLIDIVNDTVWVSLEVVRFGVQAISLMLLPLMYLQF